MDTMLKDIYNGISIQQYKTDMGFKALIEGVHNNLFVIPEYQRKYRWGKKQVEELAASLIRNLPIPPIYTFRNENGQLEVLDGQQRVMSLYFYYIGKFFRNSKESGFDYRELDMDAAANFAEALEAKYEIVPTHFYMSIGNQEYDISYNELPVEIRRKVDYIAISIVEIKVADAKMKDAILRKVFANLNSGGRILSPQELRNRIYPCAFSRMIDKINRENKKWRYLYGAIHGKCKDVEWLYRYCALKKYVQYSKGEYKIPGYDYSIQRLLDQFAEASFDFTEEDVFEYQRSLERFFENLKISKSIYKNGLLLVEGLYLVSEKSGLYCEITDEICIEIMEKQSYKETVYGGTISLKNMNKRWNVIYESLSKYVGRDS